MKYHIKNVMKNNTTFILLNATLHRTQTCTNKLIAKNKLVLQ